MLLPSFPYINLHTLTDGDFPLNYTGFLSSVLSASLVFLAVPHPRFRPRQAATFPMSTITAEPLERSRRILFNGARMKCIQFWCVRRELGFIDFLSALG